MNIDPHAEFVINILGLTYTDTYNIYKVFCGEGLDSDAYECVDTDWTLTSPNPFGIIKIDDRYFKAEWYESSYGPDHDYEYIHHTIVEVIPETKTVYIEK